MTQKIISATIFIFTLLAVSITEAQENKKYKINTIAFYNVENSDLASEYGVCKVFKKQF